MTALNLESRRGDLHLHVFPDAGKSRPNTNMSNPSGGVRYQESLLSFIRHAALSLLILNKYFPSITVVRMTTKLPTDGRSEKT